MQKKLIRITTVPQSLRILLKGQLSYMKQYYDVLAVSSNGECFEAMLKEQAVRGERIPMTRAITPLADLKALLLLIRLFIKEKPDIVHTHTPKAGILGMLAAWLTCVPYRLHTVAGLPLLVATGKKRKLLSFVERLTYACATKVYPNSFKMRDIIIEEGLAKPDKLKVIGQGSSNGIDISFFSRDVVTTSFHTGFVFCFVGRVVKDKGINELVHAFVRLHEIFEDIALVIVGDFEKDLDPIEPKVESLILDHPAINLMGFQKDVRPYLVNSDAFVFPSYREGFPNVVLQAGAMELASIVTDINGCNEIIEDGVNGKIIPPRDENALYEAMKWFYEHRNDEVVKMARNARPLIVERYEQHKVWEALLKEYQSLQKES